MHLANHRQKTLRTGLLAFLLALSVLVVGAARTAWADPALTVSPSTATVGIGIPEIKLTITGEEQFKTVSSDPDGNFEISGVEGMTIQSVNASDRTATLTLGGTTTPTSTGTITITVKPGAFIEPAPSENSTVTIDIKEAPKPSITVTAASNSVTVGEKFGTIELTAENAKFVSGINDNATQFFSLGGSQQEGLSISSASGGGTNTAKLAFEGSASAAGSFTITVKKAALEPQPAADIEVKITVTAATETTGPTITVKPTTIPAGTTNPTVTVTVTTKETSFANSLAATNFTVDSGKTGLKLSSVKRDSAAQVTLTFTGPAKAGTLSITANANAFEPAADAPSKQVDITVTPLAPTTTPTFSNTTATALAGNKSVTFTVTNATKFTQPVSVQVTDAKGNPVSGVTATYKDGVLTLTFANALAAKTAYQVTFTQEGMGASAAVTLTVNPYKAPETTPNPGTPDKPNSGFVGWDEDDDGTGSGGVGTPADLIEAIQDAEPGADFNVVLPSSGAALTFVAEQPPATGVNITGIILGFPESGAKGAVTTTYNPATKAFTLSATPDPGFAFEAWTLGGKVVSNANPWQAALAASGSTQTLATTPDAVAAGGYVATFRSATTPTPGAPEGTVTVYRLYNRWAGTHLYLTDEAEVARCVSDGWKNEGVWWYAPATQPEGGYRIIRLYNPFNGDHYYVKESDSYQIGSLERDGWRRDSLASSFWSAPANGTMPIYTLFNPFSQVDTHLYTPQMSEVNDLVGRGWERNTTIIWAAALPSA